MVGEPHVNIAQRTIINEIKNFGKFNFNHMFAVASLSKIYGFECKHFCLSSHSVQAQCLIETLVNYNHPTSIVLATL